MTTNKPEVTSVYRMDTGNRESMVSLSDYETLQADYEALQHEREMYKAACNEWLEKSQWIQETLAAKELGMHRADVTKSRIEALQAECEKLVEALNLMVTTHDEGGWPTAATTIARAALAAHRKGVNDDL